MGENYNQTMALIFIIILAILLSFAFGFDQEDYIVKKGSPFESPQSQKKYVDF